MKRNPRSRTFEEVNAKHGSHWRREAVIRCRSCSTTEQINIKMHNTLLPPAAIEKKFTQRGWEVGANEHWDVCPTCAGAKPAKPELKIVPKPEAEPPVEIEMKPEPKLVVPEPRTMQRDDRRIIFEKLNGVYLDEKRGYDPEWSDHKVATDLGVPRAWVEQVREEMFGPVATNPNIDEFMRGVKELNAYKDQLKTVEEVRKQVDGIKASINSINLPMLIDRINKLEKLEALVKKHIPV